MALVAYMAFAAFKAEGTWALDAEVAVSLRGLVMGDKNSVDWGTGAHFGVVACGATPCPENCKVLSHHNSVQGTTLTPSFQILTARFPSDGHVQQGIQLWDP